MLCSGVISWQDCLQEKGAWDTLLWFSALVGMSAQLETFGIISWLANNVSTMLAGASMSWPMAFTVLHVAYFAIHYLFASQTAHVGALYAAFLAMMVGSGVPVLIAALTLSFSTNLFGAITHYASAQGVVYYGAGYIDLPTWWKVGGIMALFQYGVMFGVGAFWWKAIGLM